MRVRPVALIMLLFFLLAAQFPCKGQGRAVGVNMSPKEVGITFAFGSSEENAFAILSASADLQGLLDAKVSIPGASLRFSRDYWVSWWEIAADTRLGLYAGSGFMAGYLRDIDNIYGWTLALSGNTGMGLFFPERRISIAADFTIDLGLSIRDSEGGAHVRLYRAGIVRSIMPGVKLMWSF